MSSRDFGDRFWALVCEFDRALWVVLLIEVMFLFLLVVAAFTLQDETAEVVLYVDFAIVLVTMGAVGMVIRKCNRR